MIQLGEKKGTKDEPHFVLRIDISTEDKNVANTVDFDIYAETSEEAQEFLNRYLNELASKYGFYEPKR